MATKKSGLGRGLESLFAENATEDNNTTELRITEIEPNRDQPRKHFDGEALAELAESIKEHGLLQPIVVRPLPGGSYQIVAGERRWRACRLAEISTVPVIIKDLDDKQTMELALIENLQRRDLNAVEEAEGYNRLMQEFNLTQEQVATRVGKSRPVVTNALRLLALPKEQLAALAEGKISAGHARALLSFKNADAQKSAFAAAIAGASVRKIEAMAKAESKAKPEKPAFANGFYREVELAFQNEMHRKAVVKSTGNEKGTITLEFYNNEELKEIANRVIGKQW